jgi:hypothetical protein
MNLLDKADFLIENSVLDSQKDNLYTVQLIID